MNARQAEIAWQEYPTDSRSLQEIIRDTPLAFRNQLKIYDKPRNEVRYLQGITERMPWRKIGADFVVDKFGFSEYGIGISYWCDDMCAILVHEATHIKYPWMKECDVEDIANTYWKKYQTIRKEAQKRVVEKLGEYGL